jgi:hypothetical protein
MSSITVQSVGLDFIHHVWPEVEHFIVSGLKNSGGEYTAEHLKVYVTQGMQQLIVAVNEENKIIGAATVELSNFPNERIAFITSVGGKMLANKEVLSQVENWARLNGATMVRGAASESVARLWRKAFNYESRYIIVEKKL